MSKENWKAIYDTATGELLSTGSVIDPEKLPPGVTVVDLDGPLNPDERWDAATKGKVPRDQRPIAWISTYHPANPDQEVKLFDVGAEVGIVVHVKDARGKIIDTFNGRFAVPIMAYDPMVKKDFTSTAKRIMLAFNQGIASRTFTGFNASGDYGVDDRVSTLVRVVEPYVITIAE